ncbi:hypothetical protein Goari_022227 [Gossypium aridum]|nr:hypothetical protein [Gossypium aridum]
MGVNAEIEFPIIEFRSSNLKQETNGWHRLCKKVREACETFGCFEVVYEKILTEVREETFGLIKELIEVPVERKQRIIVPCLTTVRLDPVLKFLCCMNASDLEMPPTMTL